MPEAMLVAPEQAFFLRENLKLRLLNARLALLSRQFDIAQSDLRDAQSALERYFDRSSRRVSAALDSVRQVPRRRAGQRAAARRHAGGHCRRRGGPLSARLPTRPTAMRSIIWLVLLCVVAVVAATTLGSNDGLVTIYWAGWRTELSLNLFLILLLGTCALLFSAAQALRSLLTLPERASEWRALRRERAAQAALREALGEYFSAATRRAHKAALRALALQRDSPLLRGRQRVRRAGQLLAAGSLHRLQDRAARCVMQSLFQACAAAGGHGVDDGARLLAAEWASTTAMPPRARNCWTSCPPAWRAARRRCG
jgi:hypothetical protein